jgi:hypothetical protein
MFGVLALISAAYSFGAAPYIHLVEQPARLRLPNASLLAEWRFAYRRGFAIQTWLAIFSALLGALAWFATGNPLWALGGAVIIFNWSYTVTVMTPVNERLRGTGPVHADAGTRALLIRWGRLHAIRAILSALATVTFSIALLS